MRSAFDLPVLRPVAALAFNLLLIAIGIGAAFTLSVREYPDVDPPVVSVRTLYTGAPAEVVEREVTRNIEDSLSGIAGIRIIRSITRDESSVVIIELNTGTDLNAAAAEVRDKVAATRRDLPDGIEDPVVEKASADEDAVMYLTLRAEGLDTAELTDLAERRLVDALGIVPGVAGVEIFGGRRYAMRIWLDQPALAARGLTPVDVANRLRAENLEVPAGRLETGRQELTLRALTRLGSAEEFAALVLREGEGTGRVRLGDVARVEIGVENYRSAFRVGGEQAIAIGILRRADANALEVSSGIAETAERLAGALPPGVRLELSYDEALFIRETLANVAWTLALTIGIIVLVIYLFLGSLRATLIPALNIPASIIPAIAVAAALGYSINVLTILAVILAIGFCVDDAVVILENIRRRQQEGEPILLAAVRATRQVGFAVFASSAALLSVILPLAFLQGNVGRLFAEFAVMLAATVVFSTAAALTLAPLLSARLFAGAEHDGRVARASLRAQHWLRDHYRAALRRLLARPALVLLGGLAFAGAGGLAWVALPQELAPDEDRGAVLIIAEGPQGAGYPDTLAAVERIEAALSPLVGDDGPAEEFLSIVAPGRGGAAQTNRAIVILRLKPWGDRDLGQAALVADLRGRLAAIPGIRAFAVAPPKLGQRRSGRQFRFAVAGTERERVREWGATMLERSGDIPGLVALDTSYKPTKPQLEIRIDRDRAAVLGLDAATIGETLGVLFSDREVTQWLDRGEEYEVILGAEPAARAAPGDIRNAYLRARNGELIPLSSVVELREVGTVQELRRVDRLAAVEIGANLVPGTTLGASIEEAEAAAAEALPPEATLRWLGESLDLQETGQAILVIFALVLVLTFLVLAAQFESFIHPLVVMTAAPLAVAGGLLTLLAAGLTVNIYSQIGMVLLVGLVAKNGILLVEFANQLRDQGMEPAQAAEDAAALRLRPILMTTAASILGALPLALASGAGAESRSTIGLIIAGGLTLGTLLTLFVVPVGYVLLARFTAAPGARAAELRRQEEAGRPPEAQPAE
ncbi:efflux RND transporter permease subunit [Roseomonas frigidaquae]|uniref:Efflux RND transporter permease subunit n=1 Tax=Falsiroseomonas frigidaquae TaxID=487318 RepID=A0ABX1EU03_9PROT|nr:efflux RND transporter permease subunit [Falsiroseomonas frigidaquae]NKE44057.1 efflux RND transporter permease subunit [Falsiroseomonas frigidaquae]